MKLVEMIANRAGFGNILAEGSERAAQILDCGREFLITSKSQEAPAHMPPVKRGLGLIYAANPYGADHQSFEHDPAYESDHEFFKDRLALLGLDKPEESLSLGPEKIRFVKTTQQFYSLMDSLCLCQFACGPACQLYGPAEIVKVVQAVTGWDISIDELLLIGERRLNMMKAFNVRGGFTRDTIHYPRSFLAEPSRAVRRPVSNWIKRPMEALYPSTAARLAGMRIRVFLNARR